MNSDKLRRRGLWVGLIILLVIALDQILKIWVKTHFYYGESCRITSWFQLVFIENNGMAFGWNIGSKYLLTLLRIATVAFLAFYVARIVCRREARTGYLVTMALIIAGAAGNIIDCMFYGLIFNDPMPPQVAAFMPEGGGYAPLFLGRVVDMLYFPLFSWDWPSWMPWVGGEHFVFFSPVFNLADSAITVGVLLLIFFYSKQISGVPFRRAAQLAADAAAEASESESTDKPTDKPATKSK